MTKPCSIIAETGDKRIPSLDGLRGISILMVLAGHGMYSIPEAARPFVQPFANGSLGVMIFFVLSGFLIHHLTVLEIEETGSFSWKGFYRRRFFRIFPAFYFYILVVCGLVFLGLLQIPGRVIAAAAFYFQNYAQIFFSNGVVPDYFVIGHYWTLALEEQFYLTWPLLVLLIRKGWLFEALAVFILLAPIIRVATYFLMPDSRAQIGMMFHTGFDSVAAGVLLGEALRRPKFSAFILRWMLKGWIVALSIVFLLYVSPFFSARYAGAYNLTVGMSLGLISICILIVYAIGRRGGRLYRILNWRPLVFVGILSYSLYIWNNLFLYRDGSWWANTPPYNFLFVFAMAAASYYLIEKPFLRLKRKSIPLSASTSGPSGNPTG